MQQAASCIGDSRIVLIGNSQIRHWFFSFEDLLSKEASSEYSLDGFFRDRPVTVNYRNGEMERCPKPTDGQDARAKNDAPFRGSTRGQVRQTCTFESPATGARVNFYWWESTFHSPVLEELLRHEASAAARAGARLVVIFSTGAYESIPENTEGGKRYHATDWTSHLRDETPRLADLVHGLAAQYSGFTFVWKDQTRLCCLGATHPQHIVWGSSLPADETPTAVGSDHCISRGTDIHAVNLQSQAQTAGVAAALAAAAPEARLLLNWNDTTLSSCSTYSDFIHHPRLFGLHLAPLLKQWPGGGAACSHTKDQHAGTGH